MFAVLRQGRYLALVAVCLVAAAGCVVAAFWQWDRYTAKRDGNDLLRANAEHPPVAVGDLLSPGHLLDSDHRLRTVTVRGEYDPSGQVFVRNRQVDNQIGFVVVTPLRTEEGPTLWVARGWAPAAGRANEIPELPPPPTGDVELTGRAYPTEEGAPAGDLPAGQVNRIDVPTLADRTASTDYGGYVELVSQDPPQDRLQRLPPPDLSNPRGGASEPQHLAYVAQWFLFGALALAAPALLIWLDRRHGEAARATATGTSTPRTPPTTPDTEPDAEADLSRGRPATAPTPSASATGHGPHPEGSPH